MSSLLFEPLLVCWLNEGFGGDKRCAMRCIVMCRGI
jgi:hypothetical protein